jgi:hypothetical protein
VDERPGELDEALVEPVIGAASAGEPQLLQNIVGFVEEPSVEALEVTEVMGIHPLALALFDEARDLRALLAHPGIVVREPPRPKSKVGIPTARLARLKG